jgi:hypothetical protein
MKLTIELILIATLFTSCNQDKKQNAIPITGTWELISATTIEKDTSFSTFNPKNKMIKIINPTHFAFFNHDLSMGKDTSTAAFTAGGGAYTLVDSVYTEHLEYFINREWENNKFQFVVKIENDTLTQKGVEKIDKLGIDHIIIEKYKRVKN